MASAEDIKKLKILTGEKNEELLSVLLDEAEAFVLSYTNRTQLRTGLEKAVRDLAVIALNRMGTEGEKSRSDVAKIDAAISPAFFSVTFTDPGTNTRTTKKFYSNTPSYPVYSYVNGVKTYKGVGATLIQK